MNVDVWMLQESGAGDDGRRVWFTAGELCLRGRVKGEMTGSEWGGIGHEVDGHGQLESGRAVVLSAAARNAYKSWCQLV